MVTPQSKDLEPGTRIELRPARVADPADDLGWQYTILSRTADNQGWHVDAHNDDPDEDAIEDLCLTDNIIDSSGYTMTIVKAVPYVW